MEHWRIKLLACVLLWFLQKKRSRYHTQSHASLLDVHACIRSLFGIVQYQASSFAQLCQAFQKSAVFADRLKVAKRPCSYLKWFVVALINKYAQQGYVNWPGFNPVVCFCVFVQLCSIALSAHPWIAWSHIAAASVYRCQILIILELVRNRRCTALSGKSYH